MEVYLTIRVRGDLPHGTNMIKVTVCQQNGLDIKAQQGGTV